MVCQHHHQPPKLKKGRIVGLELLIGVALGFLILGAKRMRTMLGQWSKAKTALNKARLDFTSQFTEEIPSASECSKSEREAPPP